MKKRGFTLVEIAVTIAILAVILPIALPNFLKMHMVANEAAIVEAMRAVVLACESYRSNQVVGAMRGYPASVSELDTSLAGEPPPYLDTRFWNITTTGGITLGERQWRGYRLNYTPGPVRLLAVGDIGYGIRDGYTLTAIPVMRGITGQKGYFVDQSGTIRYNTGGPAGPNDKALEEE